MPWSEDTPLTLAAMPNLSGYITTQEAAKLMCYHIDHVRRMIREGDLKAQKVGNMWFVSKASITEYLEQNSHLDKYDPRRGKK